MSEKKESNDRSELLAAILMALVVVATAWSAYQSTLWGGIQTFTLREVTSYSMLVVTNTLQQGQYSIADTLMFMEYIDALYKNDQKLSEFYYERFRPDFKPAVDAWLETKPFENPDAPPHPFVMLEYKKTFSEEAEKYANQSAIKLQEAEQANQNSDNYVLMTVIYAGILFVGGIFSRFHERRRLALLVVGWCIFSIATFFLLSMPVAPIFG